MAMAVGSRSGSVAKRYTTCPSEPVGAPVTTAGLKVKVPFIQDVNLIDKRVLEWGGTPTDMPTKDKLYVSVDLFARWRRVPRATPDPRSIRT